jgi:hypothetical protein
MPLPPAAPRRHLHTRAIDIRGYMRADGLIDIEAHMADTKAHVSHYDDGAERPVGAPLHDMWLRMTISPQRDIVACEAAMDATPYTICPGAAPAFVRLVGLRIEGGFIKAAMARVGGGESCTHLRELLQQMGTVAFQTLYSAGAMSDDPALLAGRAPPLLNSCYGWSDKNAMIAARFPAHYAGAVSETTAAPPAAVPA